MRLAQRVAGVKRRAQRRDAAGRRKRLNYGVHIGHGEPDLFLTTLAHRLLRRDFFHEPQAPDVERVEAVTFL